MDRELARKNNIADSARPLTSRGKKLMARQSAVLAHLFDETDQIVCSPYLRALETLECLQNKNRQLRKVPVTVLDFITPADHARRFINWYKKQQGKVVLVGHEPFISNLIGGLLKAPPQAFKIKKSSIVVLKENSTENLVTQMQITGLYLPE